ncbi:hypothetical protein ACFLUU_06175 [Chloroflexota bacterium]
MKNLEDVLWELDKMDIAPDEVPISQAAYDYLIENAREILKAEEEDEEEEE